MPWVEPTDNKDLKDIVKAAIADISNEDNQYDFMTSIRLDSFYCEIYKNKELLIQEKEILPDGEFDDVAMERKLLKLMIRDILKYGINELAIGV